jgi:hypothetical protein
MLPFAKKKKAVEMSDLDARSRAPRYHSMARVTINGFDGMAILRNINLGGFCLESRTYVAVSPGDTYSMSILPEDSALLKPFGLSVEVRWVRSTETSFSAGFAHMNDGISGQGLEKYIDYLKTHNAQAS